MMGRFFGVAKIAKKIAKNLARKRKTEFAQKFKTKFGEKSEISQKNKISKQIQNGKFILREKSQNFTRKMKFAGGLFAVFALLFCAVFAGKNFARAAGEISVNNFAELKSAISAGEENIDVKSSIVLTESLQISGNVVIKSSAGATLTRSSTVNSFFEIAKSGNLTLAENLTLDGAKKQGVSAINDGGNLVLDGAKISNFIAQPTVNILAGANFTMNSGEISSNENINYKCGTIYPTVETSAAGGQSTVDVTRGAKFTLNGGKINENTTYCGGGVYVDTDAIFVQNGGEINKNESNFFGGGVFVAPNGTYILNDGSVSENLADYNGGGIWFDSGKFEMNGGEINENTSKESGGGIVFTDWWTSKKMDVKIVAGSISHNVVINGNGGGIYDYAATFDLQLKNVSIDHNTAYAGGGIGNCPTGNLVTYVTNGGIYNDNTGETGGDFYLKVSPAAQNSGATNISQRVLGGGEQRIFADSPNSRFSAGDAPLTESSLKNVAERVYFHNETSDDAVRIAQSEVKLVISGNRADYDTSDTGGLMGYGGGIYFNGTLTIGEPDSDKTLTVEKVWDLEDNPAQIPDEVVFELRRVSADGDEVSLGDFSVKKSENWQTKITDLPGEFDYKIVEKTAGNWTVNYAKSGEKTEVKIVATNENFAPTPPIVPIAPSTGEKF